MHTIQHTTTVVFDHDTMEQLEREYLAVCGYFTRVGEEIYKLDSWFT